MYSLDIAILRYFNVYGKRESKKGPYASVLGIFKRQKTSHKPLTVVGNGLQRRDFTSVLDVIQANWLACNYKEKLNSDIFNVGSGKNYSILEIAKTISDKIDFLPNRSGESIETLANIKKISDKFGYKSLHDLINYIN